MWSWSRRLPGQCRPLTFSTHDVDHNDGHKSVSNLTWYRWGRMPYIHPNLMIALRLSSSSTKKETYVFCHFSAQLTNHLWIVELGFDISSVSNWFQVWFLCFLMLVVANLLVHFLAPLPNVNQTLHFGRVQDPGSIQQRCQVTYRHPWVHQFLPCEN